MELIPGLPKDIGIECLIRLPYDHFSAVSAVCRTWKSEIELPDFWRRRRTAGFSHRLVVMAQARVDSGREPGFAKPTAAQPVYGLTVCEPETGRWSELPPIPGHENGLPMFCRLAGSGSNLVVMGGWNPETWEVSSEVFIYDFVSATWRRGTDMPGCQRSFFACASDSDRTVLVAGGHDDEKTALRSALAYDVANDAWTHLPDMAEERDECKAVFRGGKFHVIGGYQTNSQGRFGKTAEALDLDTWKWDQVGEEFLETSTCAMDGDDVVGLQSSTWEVITEVPDVWNTVYVTGWQGKVFVVGSSRMGAPHVAYMLDKKSHTWIKVETPVTWSGHVHAGCCLEM